MTNPSLAVGLVWLLVACGDDPIHKLADAPAVDVDAPADVDGDGDTYTAAVDCNDANPTIHPGAVDECNTVDDDCDGMLDEDGGASFDSGSGEIDVPAIRAGTVTAPAVYTPPSAGRLWFCGTGTSYVNLTATANLEIAGAGPQTVLDGSMSGTVVTSVTSGVALTIHDVTLTHGQTTGLGGAIWCRSGSLTLTNAVISNSVAQVAGGGVFLDACPATITDTTVTGNQGGNVGGISTNGALTTLTRVTLTANSGTIGGALICAVAPGRLDIVDSIISGNTSTAGQGGGLYNEQVVTCTNSQIVGNVGSGVFLVAGTFASTTCDYGTTTGTNNTPNDVVPGNQPGVDYGDDATFSCTTALCQ